MQNVRLSFSLFLLSLGDISVVLDSFMETDCLSRPIRPFCSRIKETDGEQKNVPLPIDRDVRQADVIIAYTSKAGQNLGERCHDQIFSMPGKETLFVLSNLFLKVKTTSWYKT